MDVLPDLEDIHRSCRRKIGNKTNISKSPSVWNDKNRYRLKDVIQNGLCMGCGLCVSIANDLHQCDIEGCCKEINQNKYLEMKVVPPGRYRPVFLKYEKDETTGISNPIVPNEGLILKVCPGINVDILDSGNEIDKGASMDSDIQEIKFDRYKKDAEKEIKHPSINGYTKKSGAFMGPILSVRKCFASDPEVRFRAAAAGGLTALSEYLLASKKVEFIHHIRADKPNNPMLSVIHKSTTKDEVLQGSQSRYGPVAPLENIIKILKEKKPFCFIGKPCDINGLSNLAKYYPDVDKYVSYKLTISCGMIPDQSMYLEWLAEKQMKPEDVVEFRYRGCGCPGASPYAKTEVQEELFEPKMNKTTLNNTNIITKEAECDYRDFFYGRKWSCQLRCKVCPDFLGEQADVTVMDCWNNGMPKGEGPGFVLVLGRSARGEQLIQDCLKEKRFLSEVRVSNKNTWDDLVNDNFVIDTDASLVGNETNNVCYEDIIRTQPHQMTRKIANYSRQMAVKKGNIILPCESRKHEDTMNTMTLEECSSTSIVEDSSLLVLLQQAIKNFHIIESTKPGALCFKDEKNTQKSPSKDEMKKELEQEYFLFGEMSSKLNMDVKEISHFLQEYMCKNYEGACERIKKGAEI